MTKQTLQEYRWLRMEIAQLEEKLAELDARAQKITSTISEMPRGGASVADRMAETVSMIVDTQVDINDKVLEAVERMADIEHTISLLPAREQLILRKRYIDCLEWEQICVDTCYSWRQIHTIHADILKTIS